MTPFPLILASTSKYRGDLLAQLGWEFTQMSPGVDEDKVKTGALSPLEIAQTLSLFKAQAVFAKRSNACVIGSDQVCSLDGEILSKPGSAERASEQLARLQGKAHELLTAVSVISPVGTETFVNRTVLQMRKLTLSDIHAYVAVDAPYDCAGSYKLEGRGIKLFEKIEMTDHTAIIGLPLIQLTTTLLRLGFSL